LYVFYDEEENVLKKYISAILIMTLALTTLLAGFAGATAQAAGVEFTVKPKTEVLVKGANVEFDIVITNKSGAPLSGYLIKYKATGDVVASDTATIADGDTVNSTFTMNVTDSMLDQTLVFVLSSGDSLVEASAKVAKKVLSIKLKVSASVNKEMADAGESVTFTFKVENQGEADITDIVVKAPSLNGGKALKDKFSLKAGSDSYTFTYKHTVTADVTATPSISYKANGVEQPTATLNPLTVTLGKRHVEVKLSVDNNKPRAGEDVTFTLSIVNDGNVSYSDLKVTMNGEAVSFPSSRLKPGESYQETYKRSFETATEVAFSITMKDQNGETRSVSSNAIKIELPVDSSVVNEKLKLVMNVDRPQLTSAGTINFSGYVSNATEYELLDVEVSEATLGSIFRTASLQAGGQAAIEWPVDINETTDYIFSLTATDKDGNNYNITNEPITVNVQSAEPTPTNFDEAADMESGQLQEGSNKPFDWSKFFLIMAIVLIVLIVGVGIALIVLWKKGKTPGGRPGSKTGNRPAPRTQAPSSAPRKKPSGSNGRNGGPRKPSGTKSYRDRNNF
jgi:uncharacterized membrane protein